MIKPETRDELLLLSTMLALAATGQPPPGIKDLLMQAQRILPRAIQEQAEDGPAMRARRTSKYVQDAAFPRIVCLCGHSSEMQDGIDVFCDESKAGRIVLMAVAGEGDEQHLRRIDLADEVLVLNNQRGLPMKSDTFRHVAYARAKGKRVRFTDEAAGFAWLRQREVELGEMAGRFA